MYVCMLGLIRTCPGKSETLRPIKMKGLLGMGLAPEIFGQFQLSWAPFLPLRFGLQQCKDIASKAGVWEVVLEKSPADSIFFNLASESRKGQMTIQPTTTVAKKTSTSMKTT